MEFPTIVGLAASIATGYSQVPQLIKIIKEKQAESVSLWTVGVLFTGLAGWVWYGFLHNDWIIIISNLFSLVVNILIAIFSIRYKSEEKK